MFMSGLLNPRKCEAINITNKRSPITFTYSVGSHVVSWAIKVKYLDVIIYQKIIHNASQYLNRLRHAMYGCSVTVKFLAYKTLVRPCQEYGCTVWSPYTSKEISMLESLRHRAA